MFRSMLFDLRITILKVKDGKKKKESQGWLRSGARPTSHTKRFKQWCPVPEHARTLGGLESALASTNGFMIV